MSTHGYQQPGHPPAHIDALQSLRGIFAVFIFFHHLDVFPAGGDVGVVFFLMLSGFVMTYGYGGSGGCVAAVGALHSSLAFCAANGAVCLAVVDTLRRSAHGNGLRRRPPHAAAEMASVGARRRAQLQLLMIHQLVIRVMRRALYHWQLEWSTSLCIVVALTATIFATWVLHRLVEVPARRFLLRERP